MDEMLMPIEEPDYQQECEGETRRDSLLGNVEHGTRPMSKEPLMAIRYPEVGLRLAEVDG